MPVRDLMSLMDLFCLERSQSIHDIRVGKQEYTSFEGLATWASMVIYNGRL
jgi:hypothetical protein